jgi:hypothetical protein
MDEQPDHEHHHDDEQPTDGPHDVLAAEAFAVGAGDPGLHHEPAHDVLAADEFPVPAPEPHAVPPDWQPPQGSSTAVATRTSKLRRIVPVIVLGGLVFALVRRRRAG